MYKCTFDFDHPNCWLNEVSKAFPDYQFMDNAAYELPDGSLMEICLINGTAAKFSGIISFLRSSKLTKAVRLLDKGSNYLLLQITGNIKTMDFITPVAAQFNCFRLGDLVAEGGVEKWTVGAPTKSNIEALVAELKKHGKISRKRITKTPFKTVSLTKRQHSAVELAYREGYYKIPRRTNLSKLALRMNIKKTAYREHLKRAEEKIIGNFFEE